MMLSPWDAPRYLWAAIEGAGGLNVVTEPGINPALADDWRWLTAVNVPYRGGSIAWIACRMPDGLHLYTTSDLPSRAKTTRYTKDATESARVTDPEATVVAFEGDEDVLIFVGNPTSGSAAMAVGFAGLEKGERTVQFFSSVWNDWQERGPLTTEAIADGLPMIVDAGGFAMIKVPI
jgi:hypothetical protein